MESMPTPLFAGCAVALVTPFGPDGLDEPCLADLVRFHLREKTDALLVNGSTGEAAAMSAAEQRRATEIVVATSGGQIPVIVGVGGTDTVAVASLARRNRPPHRKICRRSARTSIAIDTSGRQHSDRRCAHGRRSPIARHAITILIERVRFL